MARVAPAWVDDALVEDVRRQSPVAFWQRGFLPFPDRPDPVQLRHASDRVHDQVVHPRHFRPQPLGLGRRRRKLVLELLQERPVLAFIRLLHEVRLQFAELLAGPEPFLAEERATVAQTPLFPPLGSIEYRCGP